MAWRWSEEVETEVRLAICALPSALFPLAYVAREYWLLLVFPFTLIIVAGLFVATLLPGVLLFALTRTRAGVALGMLLITACSVVGIVLSADRNPLDAMAAYVWAEFYLGFGAALVVGIGDSFVRLRRMRADSTGRVPIDVRGA